MVLTDRHTVILPAVLSRQRDWDVLRATGRSLNSIGAREEAVTLRTALAGEKCFHDSHCMHEFTWIMRDQTTECQVMLWCLLSWFVTA